MYICISAIIFHSLINIVENQFGSRGKIIVKETDLN